MTVTADQHQVVPVKRDTFVMYVFGRDVNFVMYQFTRLDDVILSAALTKTAD